MVQRTLLCLSYKLDSASPWLGLPPAICLCTSRHRRRPAGRCPQLCTSLVGTLLSDATAPASCMSSSRRPAIPNTKHALVLETPMHSRHCASGLLSPSLSLSALSLSLWVGECVCVCVCVRSVARGLVHHVAAHRPGVRPSFHAAAFVHLTLASCEWSCCRSGSPLGTALGSVRWAGSRASARHDASRGPETERGLCSAAWVAQSAACAR